MRFVFMAEDADAAGVKCEEAACLRREAEPARGEDSQDVAMCEEGDAAGGGAGQFDHVVSTGGNFVDGFALGDAGAPDGPVGDVLTDLGSGAAFENSVVPFEKIRSDLRAVAESREAGRFARTFEGTGEDKRKILRGEDAPQFDGSLLSGFCKRNVSAPGVFAGSAPFGFAMADEPDRLRGRH